MHKMTKYKQLANQVSDDPELERLNGFLNRLERIERDVKALIFEIDQMRMEKEHALRNRLAAGEKV
jgi:regulator of replication initiation timing